MIEGRTILCFASGYDAPPTSKHHVMRLLAERNTVLWVNYHASRTPTASSSDLLYMARKLGQVFKGLTNPMRNLYVLTPIVLPLPGEGWARRINRLLLVRQIKRALDRLQDSPLQIWSFTPDVAYLLDEFRAEKIVYYCVDDFAAFSGYDRQQVLRDEADLCRRSDLVVATSMALKETRQQFNLNTILVTHGVDYEHFSRAMSDNLPVPEDLADIPHPILGFFGLIRDWVDLDLLADVARCRPEWHFVLLGDSMVNLTPYRSLSNKHFLGRKKYEDLPAYCRQFDVGLVPFKINEVTQAGIPIKLREYLAAGLPVVSTPLPELGLCGPFIHAADTPESFADAVESALASDPDARREQSQAMSHETWPRKIDLICQHLKESVHVGIS